MRLCFFSGDITRSGGTERVVSTLTTGILEAQPLYDIIILSLEHERNVPFYEFHPEITLANMNIAKELTGARKFLKVTKVLRQFVQENKIDILIDVDTLLSVYSVPALSFVKTRHVSWEHFTFKQNLGLKYRTWGRKLAGRFADAIVVLTQNDQEQYALSPSIKRPVNHIYNPLILVNEMRVEQLEEPKMILSAGRLAYQKGFDILIDVAELVFAKHPDWTWVIAGEGDDRKKLEDKIKEKGLENNIFMPGNVDHIEEYYRQASMFVLTSRFEPFGLVLTEAKSFYLPCISFDVDSGPSEIILEGINGYLVPPFNVEEMASKINYLIEQPEARALQAARAMEDTEKFNLERISKQWVALFQALA